MISFFFITITCNVNNGHTNSQKGSMNDTLKVEGCQANIKMDVGSIIELKLNATPGSGYQWLLKDSSQLLQQLDGDELKFSKPETEQIKPGQPGKQILHFKAMKKGEEMIHFFYKRIWEKEIMDSCSIKFEVI
jgi:predicted secreted protein